MGNRLSKIYTRTGDDGTTGISGGDRISKFHPRMEAIGDIDELNSSLGMLIASLSESTNPQITAQLARIQHDCFDLGGELAMPGYELLPESSTEELEQDIELLNEDLPPLKDFILPGGNPSAANCHLARSICRRAERHAWKLYSIEPEAVNPRAIAYLNRLSDYLFVLARSLARAEGGSEVLWQTRLKTPEKK